MVGIIEGGFRVSYNDIIAGCASFPCRLPYDSSRKDSRTKFHALCRFHRERKDGLQPPIDALNMVLWLSNSPRYCLQPLRYLVSHLIPIEPSHNIIFACLWTTVGCQNNKAIDECGLRGPLVQALNTCGMSIRSTFCDFKDVRNVL
ncbi:uncharacterized protein ARMOST_19011 [Armillaria ostoyae]|uniref:Uncharacterized protein n=1 Tax=Armillaria ostoyae TaxID=47428 RepID=A0A284S3C4_ARMOS|nr:uncharacterized protein ARMOST_19011 [Armillaria ostoyae]